MGDPLETVRALRAKAERTTFPAEAETCRRKAEQLMARHGISEDMLAPPGPASFPPPPPPPAWPPWTPGPVVVTMPFTVFTGTNTSAAQFFTFVNVTFG